MRLSRYRRCLLDLRDLGYERVFSNNLGEAAGVSAVQVRKDFSAFGISGNRKAGYRIEYLLERINAILGKEHPQHVVLIGAGNLGSALLKYRGFAREAIRIVAAFDADPAKHSRTGPIPVLPLAELFSFIRQHQVKVAILTVPAAVAQEVAEQLVSAGIRGILNFSPVSLKVPQKVIVSNINLAIELENLLYHVNAAERHASQAG